MLFRVKFIWMDVELKSKKKKNLRFLKIFLSVWGCQKNHEGGVSEGMFCWSIFIWPGVELISAIKQTPPPGGPKCAI